MSTAFQKGLSDKSLYDEYSNHLIVMGEIHARIHEGKLFSLSHIQNNVANNAYIDVLIKTHASKYMHVRFESGAGGDATFTVHENPTVSNNGTLKSPLNRNRNSDITNFATFYTTPTVSALGTELVNELQPGGSGGFLFFGGGSGSSSRGFEEWILKPNEDYLVRLTNISGSLAPLGLGFTFYEVP